MRMGMLGQTPLFDPTNMSFNSGGPRGITWGQYLGGMQAAVTQTWGNTIGGSVPQYGNIIIPQTSTITSQQQYNVISNSGGMLSLKTNLAFTQLPSWTQQLLGNPLPQGVVDTMQGPQYQDYVVDPNSGLDTNFAGGIETFLSAMQAAGVNSVPASAFSSPTSFRNWVLSQPSLIRQFQSGYIWLNQHPAGGTSTMGYLVFAAIGIGAVAAVVAWQAALAEAASASSSTAAAATVAPSTTTTATSTVEQAASSSLSTGGSGAAAGATGAGAAAGAGASGGGAGILSELPSLSSVGGLVKTGAGLVAAGAGVLKTAEQAFGSPATPTSAAVAVQPTASKPNILLIAGVGLAIFLFKGKL